MVYQKIQVLDVSKFEYFKPEIAEEFNNYFYKMGLIKLFNREQQVSSISVDLADAESLVNAGKFHNDMKRFANYLTLGNEPQKFEEAVFKIIYEATNFKSMMYKIRKLNKYIETQIYTQHLFNTWNIVFYDKNSMR